MGRVCDESDERDMMDEILDDLDLNLKFGFTKG